MRKDMRLRGLHNWVLRFVLDANSAIGPNPISTSRSNNIQYRSVSTLRLFKAQTLPKPKLQACLACKAHYLSWTMLLPAFINCLATCIAGLGVR